MRVLLFLLLTLQVASALETLTSLQSIRALSRTESEKKYPVHIEATVTLYNPDNRDLMLFDGRFGMFVLSPELEGGITRLELGDRVRVDGQTFFGGFVASIDHARVTLLSKGQPPVAQKVQAEDLLSPSLCLAWVEVPAILVGVIQGGEFYTFIAEVHGWSWRVMLPRGEKDDEKAARLMQREVKIRGIVGNNVNKQGQITSRLLYVPDFSQIIPVSPPQITDTDSIPIVAIDQLLSKADIPLRSRVRIEGIVTYVSTEGVYVRGPGGSLLVHTANPDVVTIGDRIVATGFPAMSPFRPVFRAAQIKKINHGTSPTPLPLTFDPELLPLLQAELVTTDVSLLALRDTDKGYVLQCRSGDRFFEALLPVGNNVPSSVSAGASLRLTGICELETDQHRIAVESVSNMRLHLRQSSDIVILHHAPWWTLQRILIAMSALAVIALCSFVWIVLLRKRVASQTRVISEKLRREAMQEERQRVARELHDTIEQYLAGLSIQLGNTRSKLTKSPDEVERALDLAQSMLRHCRAEARTSIRDLRSVTLEQRGLIGAMKEILAPVAEEGGMTFDLAISGSPMKLGESIETHLLRIAQESVSNAAKHAHAQGVSVRLHYRPSEIALEIEDNGSGFDTHAPLPRGHFGLRGLQERANKIQATLTVDSVPGRGTLIRVITPFTQH